MQGRSSTHRRRRIGLIAVTALTLVAGAALGNGVAAAQAGAPPASIPQAVILKAVQTVTPAGAIAGSACTATGNTSACHLYAVAGSVTLPGQTAPVPTWKFQADAGVPAAGQQTGTGPVMVVTAGSTVTVTLDNVNITDPDGVSLGIPGLAGFESQTTGVIAGGTARTYTFKPTRPGTYLYEAGHTVNGARQVLMGLAGALIVRPAGFAATTATDLDPLVTPAPVSGFQDEATLVLGELDPKFAAAPLTYDLRTFSPAYRTINGKVYPSTDQIPTAVNNSVLLRYLNAGSENHSMGVQGVRQTVIAQDSFPGSGMSLVADQLSPGQTEDVLVKVTAEGNYPVADASGSLDTAGLAVGTTRQLAFGGMMTLLGTNVTAVTTDTVGPVSAITSITPNPAKATTPVTVTASFSDPTVDGGPSNVTSAELLIDSEATTVAAGTGTRTFTLTSTGTGTATGTYTLSAALLQTLTQGKHRLYLRAIDALGNPGALTSAVLNLAATGAATTNLSVSPSPANGTVPVTLSATGDDSALGGTVDQARYAIDCNPATSTTPCTFTALAMSAAGSAVSAESASIPAVTIAALSGGEGTHQVYVQTHDSFGLWGPATSVALIFDKTAPTGSGGVINPATNDGTKADPSDPASFRASATFSDGALPGGTAASKIVAAEGFFPPVTATTGPTQTTAPTGLVTGTGFTMVATDGAFDKATETAYGLIPLSQLTAYPDGTYTIWMHGKDAAGNWSPFVSATFVVKRGLFSDGFEANNLTAWTGGTTPANPAGRLATSAAALNVGSYGLAITSRGVTTPAYLQTPPISPAATSYHARFAVNPNRLSAAGTTGTGLFTGMSGTTQAFQVQYRRGTANNAAASVRLVAGTKSTAWVTLSSTAWSSIQVDWAKGSKATLTFTVNGVVSTITGVNSSTQAITSGQLGFKDPSGTVGSTATNNTISTAYFDTFVSSLNPLP